MPRQWRPLMFAAVIAAVLPPAAGATDLRRPPYGVELRCAGWDAELSAPRRVSYRINLKTWMWWACLAEDDCTEPRRALLVAARLVVFERDADYATVWSGESGVLTDLDRRTGSARVMKCLRRRLAPSTPRD